MRRQLRQRVHLPTTLRPVGRLGPAKLHELDGALAIALGLR